MNTATLRPRQQIVYPDSDGLPMAENTVQFNWIVMIKTNLEAIFVSRADVFVAGDLFWYPVEGDPTIRVAPDTLVAFGRPKGDRGSYMQWEEGGIAPQVVWEILSPGNRHGEMVRKFQFYEHYGVDEYYVYDPDSGDIAGWLRKDGRLQPIPNMDGWISPLLKVRFALENGELRLYGPDGKPFQSFLEVVDKVAQQELLIQQLRDELAKRGAQDHS